jgi:translation initiation factor 3 subunit I
MKPIILQGHSRPIKDLKFNSDGTQLITGSSDRNIIIWDLFTCKKSAIFSHFAAVNGFTLSKSEDYLFSSDNTGTLYFWNIRNCKISRKIEYDVTMNLKSIDNSPNGEEIIACLSGRAKNAKAIIDIINIRDTLKLTSDPSFEEFRPRLRIHSKESKFTKCKIISGFSEENDKCILASREDGSIQVLNFNNGEIILTEKLHTDIIQDFDYDDKSGLLLTVSKDGKAIVTDLKSLTIMNTYTAENPKRQLNVCKFSPNVSKLCGEKVDESLLKFHCIFAGGQDSKNVTTTHTKEGGFEVILFNLLDDSNVGSVAGHFGPVNAIAISPDGRVVVSGGEDSTVRLHNIQDISIY